MLLTLFAILATVIVVGIVTRKREFIRRLILEESGEAVILTWNVTNWLTVILMAAIGFFLIGLGMKFYQSRSQGA